MVEMGSKQAGRRSLRPFLISSPHSTCGGAGRGGAGRVGSAAAATGPLPQSHLDTTRHPDTQTTRETGAKTDATMDSWMTMVNGMNE